MSPMAANTLIATVELTRYCHEAFDPGLLECAWARLLSTSGARRQGVEFSGMANDDASLVLGEWPSLQPSPPAL